MRSLPTSQEAQMGRWALPEQKISTMTMTMTKELLMALSITKGITSLNAHFDKKEGGDDGEVEQTARDWGREVASLVMWVIIVIIVIIKINIALVIIVTIFTR